LKESLKLRAGSKPPARKQFCRKVNTAKKASYNPAVKALWLKARTASAKWKQCRLLERAADK